MSKQLASAIVNRFNMQPALLSHANVPQLTQAIISVAAHTDEEHAAAQQARGAEVMAAYGHGPAAADKPFLFSGGIAIIPITGLLINRCNFGCSWVTGYNFVRSQVNAAAEDPDVKLIVFDCHSGGGEAAGCFELCNEIRASRDRKPSLAVVDSASYSACYAIASSASRVSVIPSGGVGSIGVVAMHVDFSKVLDNFGIKVTFIHSGEHKVDGNPYEPLPEPVRKSIQARVDTTRQEFVNLVATNRGLDPKVVFDTEAACFSAAEAKDLGLVDAIAQPIDAVRAFINELSRSEPHMETDMSTVKPGAESAASVTENTPAPAAAAPTAPTAADARKAERERISAIKGHANAKDRAALADHLALNTDLSVDAAAAILAASPVESKGDSKSAFTQAMDNSQHPNVGADAGAEGVQEESMSQRILKNQSLATGVKHEAVKH